jgi:hypothetical protein
MFGFGFTRSDLIRAVWCFIFGFAGYYGLYGADILASPDISEALAAFASGAVLAGLSAVKNFVLKDGTVLKG